MDYICYIDTRSSSVPHMEPLSATFDETAMAEAMRLLARHGSGMAAHVYHGKRLVRSLPTPSAHATGNLFLDALPPEDLQAIRSALAPRSYRSGEVALQQDKAVGDVVFPVSGMFAGFTTSGTRSLQTSITGRAGVVGGLSALADTPSSCRFVADTPAEVLVCESETIRDLARTRPAIAGAFLDLIAADHARALRQIVYQSLPLPQRLARWLIAAFDMSPDPLLSITQEELSGRLGVQRTSVVEGCATLTSAGVIKQRRGKVRLLDREGLVSACRF